MKLIAPLCIFSAGVGLLMTGASKAGVPISEPAAFGLPSESVTVTKPSKLVIEHYVNLSLPRMVL